MRVITFSTKFQSKHPRKGEPTYFVEAILTQLGIDYTNHDYFLLLKELNNKFTDDQLYLFFQELSENIQPKSHTIRASHRFKEGDFFSPRVWSGKPFATPQIIFAPPVEIKKIYTISIYRGNDVKIRRGLSTYFCSYMSPGFDTLCKNDGLSVIDLYDWFKMPCRFDGKIICWNENINY